MITLNNNQMAGSTLRKYLSAAWRHNKPLVLTALLSLGLLLFSFVGLLVDPRTVIGEPVWIKPTKFAISSVFYSMTLLWLLTFVADKRRWVAIISWTTTVTLTIELVLIVIQAFRGVRSHFNVITPLDAAIFSTMGLMILLLWVVSVVALFLLVRRPFPGDERVWGIALRLALFITVIGTGMGFLMTSPTAQQLAEAQETGILVESGAHSVGVADGGPGLPFLGWSTTGGDLRVGHFIGLHALQIIPLVAYGIMRLGRRLNEIQKVRLVWIAGLSYLSFMGLVTWQALRGEPLIYPGPLTAAALGVLIILTAAAVTLTVARRSITIRKQSPPARG